MDVFYKEEYHNLYDLKRLLFAINFRPPPPI